MQLVNQHLVCRMEVSSLDPAGTGGGWLELIVWGPQNNSAHSGTCLYHGHCGECGRSYWTVGLQRWIYEEFSPMDRTLHIFWFFHWPLQHESWCFKFFESQIVCVYLDSPCETVLSTVAWCHTLGQCVTIMVTGIMCMKEGVLHFMVPTQSRHPGIQEAAKPLQEGIGQYIAPKKQPLYSIFPTSLSSLHLPSPNSLGPSWIHQ